MTKKTDVMVLIDLVRALGYKNPEKLANWIRDIIKNKEDFDKRFHVSGPERDFGRREEKFLLDADAVVLVENLCFLKPYMSCFGKSMEDSREFQPYRILAKEKGFNKAELERKYKRLRAELQAMKEESENALYAYPAPVCLDGDGIRARLERDDGRHVTPTLGNIKIDRGCSRAVHLDVVRLEIPRLVVKRHLVLASGFGGHVLEGNCTRF